MNIKYTLSENSAQINNLITDLNGIEQMDISSISITRQLSSEEKDILVRCESIHKVEISYNSNISFLKCMNIEQLVITDEQLCGIDYTFLKNLNLRYLYIKGSDITEMLNFIPTGNLTDLMFKDCSFKNLDNLNHCFKLNNLSFRNCEGQNIRIDDKFPELTDVSISESEVENVSIIKNCPWLSFDYSVFKTLSLPDVIPFLNITKFNLIDCIKDKVINTLTFTYTPEIFQYLVTVEGIERMFTELNYADSKFLRMIKGSDIILNLNTERSIKDMTEKLYDRKLDKLIDMIDQPSDGNS